TTAAFEAHIAAAGLADRITTLVQELDVHDTALLTGTSRAIRALVRSAPLDSALRAALFAAARPLLRRDRLIVRSSAVGEDSAQGSFAGQLDSILHVATEPDLEQ